MFKKLPKRRGQALIEYALLIVMLLGIFTAGVVVIKPPIVSLFCGIGSVIPCDSNSTTPPGGPTPPPGGPTPTPCVSNCGIVVNPIPPTLGPGQLLDKSGSGFCPATPVYVKYDATILIPEGGQAYADADGNVTVTVSVPADAVLGSSHTITLSGKTDCGGGEVLGPVQRFGIDTTCTVPFSDDFQRSGAMDSWGASPDGVQYNFSAGAGGYLLDNQAVGTFTGGDSPASFAPIAQACYGPVQLSLSGYEVPGDPSADGGNRFFYITVPGGDFEVTDGGFSYSGSSGTQTVDVPLLSISSPWTLKVQYNPSVTDPLNASGTIQMKIWDNSSSEPDWQLTNNAAYSPGGSPWNIGLPIDLASGTTYLYLNSWSATGICGGWSRTC
jgi:hypothetical protein